MKKISIALSALLLIGLLAACGTGENQASPSPNETASPKVTVSPSASPGITESVDEAGEKTKEGLEEAGDRVKDAGEDVKKDLTGEDKNKE